ncbi:hypothetical protein ACQRBN_11630 [Bariatricus sp. SGI.154]|uniref:hypothetical protein n=1 Tax=Bariatricus sp. SGI.154 TaxID=3420549 RepID=UPI003D09439B
MKQKMVSILCVAVLICTMLAGCGKDASTGNSDGGSSDAVSEDSADGSSDDEDASESGEAPGTEDASESEGAGVELADGVYSAKFDTDSSMFHVNEANEGKGVLTVENGEMSIHVSLVSKNIINLFVGTAEDAQKDGANILEPTTDTVTYSDGMNEEVYGFDIPVPAIGEEFDVALLGKKDKWYDHKVSVSDPQPQ